MINLIKSLTKNNQIIIMQLVKFNKAFNGNKLYNGIDFKISKKN
jgi:hypothetical protein